MWTPKVQAGTSPLFLRLADALANDISSGALSEGTKLPPHRDLAYRLSIGVGTVTKAYEEVERRGLIEAHVGRGSFVSAPVQSRLASGSMTFDLAMNTAPCAPTHARIAEAMNALRRRPDLADHFSYAPPLGRDADRNAGASWLRRISRLDRADPNTTICTLGAQHAMSLLFSVLIKPGDTIIAENVNYIGLKALANQQGYALHGVAMDREGLCPDALDKAAQETGATTVYTVPTLQNPTARIMSMARREAIAKVARRHDLTMIEDDIYAHFASSLDICPIANLAPERTYLLSGLSKSVAPGLRAAYLSLPDESLLDRLKQMVRSTIFAPPSLPFGLASLMIENGMAEAITGEVQAEVAARTSLALRVIGKDCEPPATSSSLHLWLPMDELRAEKVTGRAMRSGLSIMPPGASAISSDAETGLRISLGAIDTQANLSEALRRLKSALDGEASPQGRDLM